MSRAFRDLLIVGIASVSGDRGRRSNYLYGSAKAGGAIFWLGFVDTEMTFGLPELSLVADPELVGEQIARAEERRVDVVYVP